MLLLIPMKIKSADLYDQAFTPRQIPHTQHPQVAVVGRSNVGKSSLLAKMMRRKKLVKTSSTPGKTRALFYYLVNESILLVDLPGYGFSRAPKQVSSRWRALVEAYLDGDSGPDLVLQLIDIRHPPTSDDIVVNRLLSDRSIQTLIVATKADKISRSARSRSLDVIARELATSPSAIVPFSAKDSSFDPKELWDNIISILT